MFARTEISFCEKNCSRNSYRCHCSSSREDKTTQFSALFTHVWYSSLVPYPSQWVKFLSWKGKEWVFEYDQWLKDTKAKMIFQISDFVHATDFGLHKQTSVDKSLDRNRMFVTFVEAHNNLPYIQDHVQYLYDSLLQINDVRWSCMCMLQMWICARKSHPYRLEKLRINLIPGAIFLTAHSVTPITPSLP